MTQPTAQGTGAASAATSDTARNALLALRGEIAKAVVGQEAVVSGLVIALLCRGHVLLEGVPGVAKTLLVRAMAAALELDFKRVQFTPDLMPGDVTGSLVYDARTAVFEFRRGPVFTNLLLADEINHSAQDAIGAPRIDGGTSGQRRGPTASPARPVHRRRNTEPDRVRGHLPVARGAAGPVPAEAQCASAAAGSGDRDPGPSRPWLRPSRPVRGETRCGRLRTGSRPGGGPPGPGGRRGAWLHRRCCRGDAALTVATAGCVAARRDGAAGHGAVVGVAVRPQLRHARRRQGHGPPTLRHRVSLRPEAELEGASTDGVLDGILAAVPVPR